MARKIAVEIVGDASSLEKAFAKSSRSAQKFEQSTTGIGKSTRKLGRGIGLLAGGLGVAGLAGAAKAAFDEFSEAQKVSAQTAAVLKSTGGTAGVTAGHVDKLATSLMNMSGTDDEAIKSGENLLLTFTRVQNKAGKGNKIFDRATRTMLDMSTALGQDMKTSAIQLGKALNDPIKGVTALQRVGVSFTKAQKEQIKTLENTGHHLEAQKLILKELNKEFAGSAKAGGQTFGGQMDKLKNTLLNLGASIAETLMPTVQKLLTQLNKWLSNSKNQKKILDAVKSVIGAVSTAIRVLVGAFKFLNKITGSTKHTLELLIAVVAGFKVLQFASKVKTVANNFGLLNTNAVKTKGSFGGLKGSTNQLASSFGGKLGLAAMVGLAGYELSKLIRKIPGWDKAMKRFGGTVYDVAASLGLVKGAPPKALPHAAYQFLARRAKQLRASGLTAKQTADELARTHPNVPRHDIDVIAGTKRAFSMTVNGGLHLHGVQNMRQFEQQIHKRSHQRPQTRRGPV